MQKSKQNLAALRITVNPAGVLRVEGERGKRPESLELTARIMPAIQRLDKAIRREFT